MSGRVGRAGRRRPALVCGLAFATGIWACRANALPETFLVLLLASLLCFFAVEFDARGLLAVLLFVGLGAIRFHISQSVYSPTDLRLHQDSGGQVLLYGRVAGEPEVRPNATQLVIDVDSVLYPDSLCPRSGRVLARFKFDPGITPDSRVVLSGRIRPPPEASNPGDFSWADYFLQRDLHAQFEPAQGSAVLSVTPTPGLKSRVIAPLRSTLKATLASHLDGEEAALLVGLILGEKSNLPRETVSAFQQTGTLHLLAVSGSNVGVVVALVWGVLLFLRIPRPLRIALAAVAIVGFCYLAHSEDSVMRATAAGLLVLGAMGLRRRPEALNVWGCALLLLLAWEPQSFFGLGFQLSFGATLGILLVAPLVPQAAGGSWWGRAGLLITGSVLVSLAAQTATLPILAESFNQVPLVTPLANLICVPLAGAATFAGALCLVLAPFGDLILKLSSAACWLCLKLLLLSVHAFNGLGVPVAYLSSPGVLEVGCFAGLLLVARSFACHPSARRRILFCTASGLAVLLIWTGFRAPPPPELLVLKSPFLNVLLRLPDGSVWQATADPRYPLDHAAKASRTLGWGAPVGQIDLKASSESTASTLCKISGYMSPEGAGSKLPECGVQIWCSACDSLPLAVCVTYSDAAILVYHTDPVTWPDLVDRFRTVVWVTDSDRAGPGPSRAGRHDTMVLTGRAGQPAGPDSVQALHTRRQGAIRILWRDSAFQSEPSIR